jgi:hypothetical protein
MRAPSADGLFGVELIGRSSPTVSASQRWRDSLPNHIGSRARGAGGLELVAQGRELCGRLEVQALDGADPTSRHHSPRGIASYRDTFRLLFSFAQARLRRPPSALTLDDLEAPCRRVPDRSRDGARRRRQDAQPASDRHPLLLSFRVFRGAADAPPRSRRSLRRPIGRHGSDVATNILLLLAAQTGLRLSELIGKGRKERCTPLTTHARLLSRLGSRSRRGGERAHCSPTCTGAGSAPTVSNRSWPSMWEPPARNAPVQALDGADPTSRHHSPRGWGLRPASPSRRERALWLLYDGSTEKYQD